MCERCGIVIEENTLSLEDERRYFSSQEIMAYKRTTIPRSKAMLPAGQHMIRIKHNKENLTYNSRLQRDLNMCRDCIRDFGSKLKITETTKHEALRLVARYISRHHITKGDIPYLVSASIFIALRNSGNYKPLDRFLRDLGLSKKKFSKVYRMLRESLHINVKLPNAEDYVYIFAKELQLSSTCVKIAINTLKKVKLLRNIMCKNAASLAAAAIYYASTITGEKRSRRRVAQVASTTESTIKSRYDEIISVLNLNSSSEMRDMG